MTALNVLQSGATYPPVIMTTYVTEGMKHLQAVWLMNEKNELTISEHIDQFIIRIGVCTVAGLEVSEAVEIVLLGE